MTRLIDVFLKKCNSFWDSFGAQLQSRPQRKIPEAADDEGLVIYIKWVLLRIHNTFSNHYLFSLLFFFFLWAKLEHYYTVHGIRESLFGETWIKVKINLFRAFFSGPLKVGQLAVFWPRVFPALYLGHYLFFLRAMPFIFTFSASIFVRNVFIFELIFIHFLDLIL